MGRWRFRPEAEGGVITVTSMPSGLKRLSFVEKDARRHGMTMSQLELVELLKTNNGKDVILDSAQVDQLKVLRDKAPVPMAIPVQQTLDTTVEDTLQGLLGTAHRGGTPHGEVEQAASTVNTLQQLSKSNMNYWMLQYDIPDSLKKECPNPSRKLWRYGFRMQLSCWVLPERSLDATTIKKQLADWARYPKVEVHLIKYASDQLEKIRQTAQRKLVEYIGELHRSFIMKIDKAAVKLDEARRELDAKAAAGGLPGPHHYERAEQLFVNTSKRAIRKSTKALEDALQCARMFDESENLAHLFDGLRQIIDCHREAVNALSLQRGQRIML